MCYVMSRKREKCAAKMIIEVLFNAFEQASYIAKRMIAILQRLLCIQALGTKQLLNFNNVSEKYFYDDANRQFPARDSVASRMYYNWGGHTDSMYLSMIILSLRHLTDNP